MTGPRRRPASIRAHLLGIVLLGAILPLGLIGFWLTRRGVRSGEELLDSQLTNSLKNIERAVSQRWEYRRSDLLLLADNEVARHALSSGAVTAGDSAYFADVRQSVGYGIREFVYHDRTGRPLYSSAPPVAATSPTLSSSTPRDTTPGPSRRTLHLSLLVQDGETPVGTMDADVYLDTVIPSDSARLLLPGSVLAVRDRASGAVLLPLAGEVEFPAASATPVVVQGAPWMVRVDSLVDPPFDLAVGAPVAPYVTPFEKAGRLGLVALAGVAFIALLLSSLLTTRLSRSSGALVEAANAVASGDLTREAALMGPSEFHRLASSFNTMTESLRRLVAELSHRKALAAVGEFAASLSHEVRNALTSVQIDLERVDERTESPKNRALLERALAQVRRLDAAVTGSLRIARSGTVIAEDVNLSEVLREAIRVADPSFTGDGGRIAVPTLAEEVGVRGDREALHQLFLNLLLNAQQALAPGGETTVSVRFDGGRVVVAIADTGCGMTSEQISRAFDPYYTTRPKGTGLGLPIARLIAVAHGGDLSIQSTLGAGTTVEVGLPAA